MPEPSPYAQPATFPEFFNKLLASHALSGAQAARRLGVAESQVGRWRRGQGGISLENLERIHEEFGVDLDYLRELAGLRNSSPATATAGIDAERQAWGAWYQHLLDSQVPRRMWKSYTRACEALAAHWASLPVPDPSSDSTPAGGSVSTPPDDGLPTDAPSPPGQLTAESHRPRARFPRGNRSILSAAS